MTDRVDTSADRFLSIVERWAHVDRATAERATRATLATLAERLSPGEARDIAELLPPEFFAPLHTTSPAEPFDVDEFLRRVAAREGTDVTTAEQHARAVFVALRRTVGEREMADMKAQLPRDLRALVDNVPKVPPDEFFERVAARAGVDVDTAQRATNAVLETLAERIAEGDVDDLISRLPAALHPPLVLGKCLKTAAAARMPLGEFLQHVAEREGTTTDVAARHAAAVFAELRDAAGEEFFDIAAQLPNEYSPLLAHR
jgi:uncharacterized protein (DUF2267 family)